MALFWIGYDADRTNQTGEAESNFKELLKNFPTDEYSREARLRLAMLYYREKKDEEAAQNFVVLIESPNPPKSLDSAIYLWTATRMMQQKKYENAISVYTRLLERFPQDELVEEACYRIAQAFSELGNWSEAARYYDRVIKDFPSGQFSDLALLGRAKVDLHLNDMDNAITRLNAAAGSLDPAVAAQAGLSLGDAYEKAGRQDEALAAYLRVALLYEHPEIVPEAYWKAAQILKRQGKNDQARQNLDELHRLYPNSPYSVSPEKPQSATEPLSATRGQ